MSNAQRKIELETQETQPAATSPKRPVLMTVNGRSVSVDVGNVDPNISQGSRLLREAARDHRENFAQAERSTFMKRVVAIVIDNTILGVIMEVLFSVLAPFFNVEIKPGIDPVSLLVSVLFLQIILLTVYFAYIVGLPVLWNGQTVGKKLLKIRIVNQDGTTALSWGTMVWRETFYKAIAAIPLCIPYLRALSPERLAWHDQKCDTMVVDV